MLTSQKEPGKGYYWLYVVTLLLIALHCAQLGHCEKYDVGAVSEEEDVIERGIDYFGNRDASKNNDINVGEPTGGKYIPRKSSPSGVLNSYLAGLGVQSVQNTVNKIRPPPASITRAPPPLINFNSFDFNHGGTIRRTRPTRPPPQFVNPINDYYDRPTTQRYASIGGGNRFRPEQEMLSPPLRPEVPLRVATTLAPLKTDEQKLAFQYLQYLEEKDQLEPVTTPPPRRQPPRTPPPLPPIAFEVATTPEFYDYDAEEGEGAPTKETTTTAPPRRRRRTTTPIVPVPPTTQPASSNQNNEDYDYDSSPQSESSTLVPQLPPPQQQQQLSPPPQQQQPVSQQQQQQQQPISQQQQPISQQQQQQPFSQQPISQQQQQEIIRQQQQIIQQQLKIIQQQQQLPTQQQPAHFAPPTYSQEPVYYPPQYQSQPAYQQPYPPSQYQPNQPFQLGQAPPTYAPQLQPGYPTFQQPVYAPKPGYPSQPAYAPQPGYPPSYSPQQQPGYPPMQKQPVYAPQPVYPPPFPPAYPEIATTLLPGPEDYDEIDPSTSTTPKVETTLSPAAVDKLLGNIDPAVLRRLQILLALQRLRELNNTSSSSLSLKSGNSESTTGTPNEFASPLVINPYIAPSTTTEISEGAIQDLSNLFGSLAVGNLAGVVDGTLKFAGNGVYNYLYSGDAEVETTPFSRPRPGPVAAAVDGNSNIPHPPQHRYPGQA